MLSGYATILQDVSNPFWAFTAVMLSESSQVSKQSDAFAKSFPFVFASLWARLSTLPVRWGTLLPRYICWSYYYDPRCFRESPSNLAMFCVPSVKILAIILESISWCYLGVGILLLGLEPETHPTHFMLIVFARSFRLLVTFALVLEVRGISFFQYHEPSWQKFF